MGRKALSRRSARPRQSIGGSFTPIRDPISVSSSEPPFSFQLLLSCRLFALDLRVGLEAVAEVASVCGGDEAERAESVEPAERVGEGQLEEFAASRGKDGAAIVANSGSGLGESGTPAEVELVVTATGAARDRRSAARGAVWQAVDTCR